MASLAPELSRPAIFFPGAATSRYIFFPVSLIFSLDGTPIRYHYIVLYIK